MSAFNQGENEDTFVGLRRHLREAVKASLMAHEGTFLERLAFYMVNFSGYIEKSSLKLCQEWVRNTVDPDLVENPDDKNKLGMDLDSMRGMIEKGVELGELKKDTPVEALSHSLVDVLYGEMLCWDMSGGAYSFEERTKEFCRLFLPEIIKPYIILERISDFYEN